MERPAPKGGRARRAWIRAAWTAPIAVVALWYAFRQAEPSEVLGAFADVHLGWVAAALAAMAASVLVRFARWGLLVRAVAPVSAGRLFRICAIGIMAIDVLPVRTGELVRPLLLKRQAGVPFGAGMATCVVERLLDLVSVLAVLFVGMAWAELPSLVIRVFDQPVDLAVQGRNAILVVLVVLGLPGAVLMLAGEPGVRIIERLLRPLPARLRETIAGALRTFADAHRALGRPGVLAAAGALSALVWLGNLAVLWLLLQAFGLEGIGLAESAVVLLVTALALMVPSPAGAVGVFEAGAVAGLALYAVEPSAAAAFAVALHAVHVGMFVAFGLGSLGAEGVRFGDISREAMEGEPAATG